MGTTALNAYAGLAGLYFVRDNREHELQVRYMHRHQLRAMLKIHATFQQHSHVFPFYDSVVLQLSGVLPSGRYEWPLTLKDYWFTQNEGQLWYNLFGEHEVRGKQTLCSERSIGSTELAPS